MDQMKIVLSSIVKSFLEPLSYIYEDEDEGILELLVEQINTTSAIENHSRRIPQIDDYVEHIVPSLSSVEFQYNFRMKPSTFEFLLHEIGEKLIRSRHGNDMVPADKQLLLTLWRFATPDPYSSLNQRFNVGQATAIRTVRRVSKAICTLSPKYIVWPSGSKVSDVTLGFSQISGLPDIIGIIDGTHVNIPIPKKNPEAFVNLKGYHSVHLQAVCDHVGCFTNIYVGNMGSICDESAFSLSPLQEYINDTEKFPNNTHLIGDTGYKLHQRLLTPYLNDGQLTECEKNYNSCHFASRMVIKKAFAHLRCRWKSLQRVLGITQMDYISCHILACCVLHNICLLKEDKLEGLKDAALELQDENIVEETVLSSAKVQDSSRDIAEDKRDLICSNLYKSKNRHVKK
ncbi:PREDICTED: putative nuclease HARBI1 [Dinoponera quadriceps]|uniref:Nuclease HARBI1 n=1 Tax=Dinoponera quadriceps TaxID=609295 RepID=A0A6P3WR90_DINQU|nr:PREDICTED: putative nuclease HARBI1 [Dinoponera quadriceps]